MLNSARLRSAILNYAHLEEADLSGPKRWSDLDVGTHGWERGAGADLRGGDLRWAFLTGANLTNALLSSAKLEGAFFDDADLSGAHLAYAEGKTNEELHKDAKSLWGALMPNHQAYERWLKDWLTDHERRGILLTDREKAVLNLLREAFESHGEED